MMTHVFHEFIPQDVFSRPREAAGNRAECRLLHVAFPALWADVRAAMTNELTGHRPLLFVIHELRQRPPFFGEFPCLFYCFIHFQWIFSLVLGTTKTIFVELFLLVFPGKSAYDLKIKLKPSVAIMMGNLLT